MNIYESSFGNTWTLKLSGTKYYNDFEVITGNEQEILNVIRTRFKTYMDIFSFRMDVKNGQREWKGIEYTMPYNLELSIDGE